MQNNLIRVCVTLLFCSCGAALYTGRSKSMSLEDEIQIGGAMTVSLPSSPAEPDADEGTQEMGPVLGPKEAHEQVLQDAGIASTYNQTTA